MFESVQNREVISACASPCDVEEDVWVYTGCVGQTQCGSVRQDISPSKMHEL